MIVHISSDVCVHVIKKRGAPMVHDDCERDILSFRVRSSKDEVEMSAASKVKRGVNSRLTFSARYNEERAQRRKRKPD